MTSEILCIIPGPTEEVARKPVSDRWCFGCRKQLPHDWVLYRDKEPSWYDPIWIIECSRCHKDRTRFPSG